MAKVEEPIVTFGSIDMNISIPRADFGLFKNLASRFGWKWDSSCLYEKKSGVLSESEKLFLEELKSAGREAIDIRDGKIDAMTADELINSL